MPLDQPPAARRTLAAFLLGWPDSLYSGRVRRICDDRQGPWWNFPTANISLRDRADANSPLSLALFVTGPTPWPMCGARTLARRPSCARRGGRTCLPAQRPARGGRTARGGEHVSRPDAELRVSPGWPARRPRTEAELRGRRTCLPARRPRAVELRVSPGLSARTPARSGRAARGGDIVSRPDARARWPSGACLPVCRQRPTPRAVAELREAGEHVCRSPGPTPAR